MALYDAGVAVQRSPSLEPLARGAALHLHPSDLAALDTADGATLRVRTPRGAIAGAHGRRTDDREMTCASTTPPCQSS